MCFLRIGRGSGGWKLALLALVAAASRAEASSSNSLVLVGAFERKSAITIQVPAQALVFQVQVRTSSDDWEVRLQETETARSQLAAAATQQGFRVQVSQGVVLGQRKIREHIDECAAGLGTGVDVEVAGFEEPIMTRQVGERSVELSLPVRVNYTRKAR